jgi:Flp pilus assembly protein TadG
LRYQLWQKQRHFHHFSLRMAARFGLTMSEDMTMWTRARNLLRDFITSRRGNVAMMFGIALVPMTIAAGAGLDYARGALVRSQMSDALDAAALAVGSTTGLTKETAEALAQKYFDANYAGDKSNGKPTVSIGTGGFTSTGSVKVDASYNLPTTLLKIVGKTTVPVTTSATVVWGQSKLWVALVLDNSGSMAQGDSTGTQMDALKNASKQLLTILQNASTTAGDVKVAIIPFDVTVNVGTSNVNASWIDWTDWEAPPTYPGTNYSYAIENKWSNDPDTISFRAWGPGDKCPFTDSSNNRMSPYGFRCAETPTNGASTDDRIPSSGTYTGYICPGIDSGTYGNSAHRDRYYNGCYTSVKDGTNKVTVATGWGANCNGFSSSNCSCTGSDGGKSCRTQRWTHVWVKNNRSTWGGCIMDRHRDSTINYDVSNIAPDTGSTPPKGFPATNPADCLGATVTTLGHDWTSLTNKINAMAPNSATNQAIGMAHGWQTLTNASPYSPGAVPANTSRYIIILSDGLNTKNRWWGNGSSTGTSDTALIDGRMDAVCAAAKADGITVYSIFLNISNQGNSAPLQNCASDSTKYFALTSTGAVVSTFQQIGQSITNVRVSK